MINTNIEQKTLHTLYQTQNPTHNGVNKKTYTQCIKPKTLHTMDPTNNEYYVNLIQQKNQTNEYWLCPGNCILARNK